MKSAEARVGDCLARIRAREPQICAWAHVDAEPALAQARALDRMPSLGPLHGVPVGIKDVLDTYDMPTRYGSSVYHAHVPTRDSNCVAQLRAAGAVILGKTATTEFASPIPIGVRNPLDFTRTPGVSSSGSAAAVADGMVPLALGTQTGGSIIRPAAYCGLYGYKASIDALDRGGIHHLRPSLDSLGAMARSLEDLARLRPFPDLGRAPRLAFCRTHEWHLARPETRDAVLGAARKLDATEVVLPTLFQDALASFRIIVLRESAVAYEPEFHDHLHTMNTWWQKVAEDARSISDQAYAAAQSHAAECRAYLATLFRDFDAIVTPATAGEASQQLTGLEDQTFCPLWTLMHGPCLTSPAFKGPSGMPMGLQLVGAVNRDEKLLAVARWVDTHLGHPNVLTPRF